MFEKILVPTDGSELATKAGHEAVQLAKKTGGKIIVTHIIDQSSTTSYDVLEKNGNEYMKIILDNAIENNVECESMIIFGSPKYDILKLTIKSEADCVMLGTHGKTGIKSTILGSFAQNVIKTIDLPIILIK
jgi:nucleotide-binding universal stress UspA family protein